MLKKLKLLKDYLLGKLKASYEKYLCLCACHKEPPKKKPGRKKKEKK